MKRAKQHTFEFVNDPPLEESERIADKVGSISDETNKKLATVILEQRRFLGRILQHIDQNPPHDVDALNDPSIRILAQSLQGQMSLLNADPATFARELLPILRAGKKWSWKPFATLRRAIFDIIEEPTSVKGNEAA